MSAATTYLEKRGWICHSRKKRGMMIVTRWRDPKSNGLYNQGMALQIQRDRNKAAKAAVSAPETGRKVAVIACGPGLGLLAGMLAAVCGPNITLERVVDAVGIPDLEQKLLHDISENAHESARRSF